jgi:3-deoxy-7-phosphoheptulonate synthase
MIIVLQSGARQDDVDAVVRQVEAYGFRAHVSQGVRQTIVGVIGEGDKSELGERVAVFEAVERVMPVAAPYKLAGRSFREGRTRVRVGDVEVGPDTFTVMAGPCAVENREMLLETARFVRAAGGKVLRGGAFKPRTSPYSFQGLGREGLALLAEAKEETGLLVDTEVLDPRDVETVAEVADFLQIGTRNMQNYALLREVGRLQKPVILKRGFAATYEEWLMAAEYILSEGNDQVILCERGIRTFEPHTRNTLDLTAVPAVKELSHLPIIVDPSHGTGRWSLVVPAARAAAAIGADGLLVEVHPRPQEARSDGAQSLSPERFRTMMAEVGAILGAMGRTFPSLSY